MSLLVNKMYYPHDEAFFVQRCPNIFIRCFIKLRIGWLINVISQVPEERHPKSTVGRMHMNILRKRNLSYITKQFQSNERLPKSHIFGGLMVNETSTQLWKLLVQIIFQKNVLMYIANSNKCIYGHITFVVGTYSNIRRSTYSVVSDYTHTWPS